MDLMRKTFVYFLIFLFTSVYSFLTAVLLLIRIIRRPGLLFYKKEREVPPVLNDPTLGNHGFHKLKNGIKIHYVAAGNTSHPLMLFLHGFPECWYSWRHQLLEFQKDYRVVALDLRGYGHSDKPKHRSDYHIDKLAEDVKLMLSAFGNSSCTLVAHDWGGAIAFHFVQLYPDLVDKLIVMNTARLGLISELFLSFNVTQLLKSWYMFLFLCPVLPEVMLSWDDCKAIEVMLTQSKSGGASREGAFSSDDIEAYKYYFSQSGAFTPPINYYRSVLLSATEEDPRQKRVIQVPTLMIWGDNDKALGNDLAVKAGSLCQDYTLKLVNGASHWVQQEYPEVVNRHMRDWLGRKVVRKDAKSPRTD